MKEAATIVFKDSNSLDEVEIIVRYDQSQVSVCLSVATDGEIEVTMTKHDAKELMRALQVALT